MNSKISTTQYWAWVLLSLSAPLAVVAGKSNWVWVAFVGGVCSFIAWLQERFTGEETGSRWYTALQVGVLGIAAGEMARWSGYCWPDGIGFPVVGLVLLVTGAVCAWQGTWRAATAGCAMVWLAGILYCIVLFAGAADIRVKWLKPELDVLSYALIFVLLIPCAAKVLNPGKSRWPMGIAVGFALAICLSTAGVLSYGVIRQEQFPFYAFSKSLNLLGFAERFESLVSVALSIGFFSLLSILFCVAGTQTEVACQGKYRWGIVACAMIAVIDLLFIRGIPEQYLAAVALAAWVILPLLRNLYLWIKNRKNNENIS